MFTFRALEHIQRKARCHEEYEHINEYIFHHPEEFTTHLVQAPPALRRAHLNFTVDTAAQLQQMKWIYSQLADKPRPLQLQEVIRLLDNEASIP